MTKAETKARLLKADLAERREVAAESFNEKKEIWTFDAKVKWAEVKAEAKLKAEELKHLLR